MSDWRRCAECNCLLPRVCNSCSTSNETYSNTRMMQERIAQLEAKLAAAEADAGRWREVRDRLWIRSQTSMAGGDPRPALEVIIGCAFMDQPPKSPGRGDELDAAIDAARGAK